MYKEIVKTIRNLYHALKKIPEEAPDKFAYRSTGFGDRGWFSTIRAKLGGGYYIGPFKRIKLWEKYILPKYHQKLEELVHKGWKVKTSNRFWLGSYIDIRDPDKEIHFKIKSHLGWTPWSWISHLFYGIGVHAKLKFSPHEGSRLEEALQEL